LNITVLCSNAQHPVNAYLEAWSKEVSAYHNIKIVRRCAELTSGDFLFLISCSELIKQEYRDKYTHALVLHASDLPKGRGWSPHVWDIMQGEEVITLCLLEAEDKVDTGRIWLKHAIPVKKTALWNEVNNLLFESEIRLMNEALVHYDRITPYQQAIDIEPTYHRKRVLEDSWVDPCSSIAEQFNLIRMCDPERYPAWFELHGKKYKLVLEEMGDE